MDYLHKKKTKNIGLLFLSIFLWLHAVLQTEINTYVIFVWVVAFGIMAWSNSLFLAIVTLLSVIGIYSSSELIKYIAIGSFATILFIGVVLIVGGPKRADSGYSDSSYITGEEGGDGGE